MTERTTIRLRDILVNRKKRVASTPIFSERTCSRVFTTGETQLKTPLSTGGGACFSSACFNRGAYTVPLYGRSIQKRRAKSTVTIWVSYYNLDFSWHGAGVDNSWGFNDIESALERFYCLQVAVNKQEMFFGIAYTPHRMNNQKMTKTPSHLTIYWLDRVLDNGFGE